PHGRTMMLNHLHEELKVEGGETFILGPVQPGMPQGKQAKLTDFWLDRALPVWRFAFGDSIVERRVVMPHRQNTVHVGYRLISGPNLVLTLSPYVHFRPHEGSLKTPLKGTYAIHVKGDEYEVVGDDPALPPLRIVWRGEHATFAIRDTKLDDVVYAVEKSRGYDNAEDLYGPGCFTTTLTPDRPAFFVASTESWTTLGAITSAESLASERERRVRLVSEAEDDVHDSVGAELVLAADQFVISPSGRIVDAARACAVGDELRTVIAGYPWFTDWGRDTMISLEGLTITTGRFTEARYILRTFARYMKDGLIPNMFPEGNNAGLYHTADATLWFFHALARYVHATKDKETLRILMPTLRTIVDAHFRGTHYNIHVDPADGLLTQGQDNVQLTWMDAKVGDLVVTPRRGKAVELNALFYNALCYYEGWLREAGDNAEADTVGGHAARAQDAFNRRFWIEKSGYCFDVVDGFDNHEGTPKDDDAFRPNQLLAISLDHPILQPDRWKSVVDQARERLLTPVGLRSLAPGHKDYKPKYFGDLHTRDMAYHQGTVWAWLIGPFIDAFRKVHPDELAAARDMLVGLEKHLNEGCVGSISEIFDAEAPYVPRGCVAQAWSVAEVLRSWANLHRTDAQPR
ncbi:MAG TPA: amylo-alpha-1,6-glucosidase, partial [Polyangiaceae bacterium]